VNHWTWVGLAAVAAGLAGLAIQRGLATLSYRRPDEATLPIPGPRWWVPLATATATAGLVARLGTPDAWPWLLPTLPVALLGPWLAAIDLDVQRLPDRLMLTLGVLVGVGVAGTSLLTGSPSVAIWAAVGAAISFLGHLVLHRISRGGLGFADVTLAGILGLATASISLTTLWWSLMITAAGTATWALATRQRQRFAFGPWLTGAAVATMLP